MTRTMVLGLLKSAGPMSGYEIQQMMQSAQTDMWAYVKPASIYHALKKLQEEGKVVLEKVEQTGLRTKSIFNITEDGERELNELLVDSLSSSSVVFPAPLYTALTFLENLTEDEIITALEKQKLEITNIYESMKLGYEQKQANIGKVPEKIDLIFQNMYKQCELQLEHINGILEIVREGEYK
ncbi:PadR family transcriptional regulator [Bacillus solimangrovi]|uniref:PadR family transcriptional regulator n=1 Tax=Bacillus solimangrovi TaxID=1305675 RepID=A0A1E5LE71_9BACI|nr:PadR family transcriptional regulator [Bacillus solimangrovi]OEH92362.1 PadR family transcriptional regulator [Bacillus solimangrovi]